MGVATLPVSSKSNSKRGGKRHKKSTATPREKALRRQRNARAQARRKPAQVAKRTAPNEPSVSVPPAPAVPAPITLPPLLVEIRRDGMHERFTEIDDPRERFCNTYNGNIGNTRAFPVDIGGRSAGDGVATPTEFPIVVPPAADPVHAPLPGGMTIRDNVEPLYAVIDVAPDGSRELMGIDGLKSAALFCDSYNELAQRRGARAELVPVRWELAGALPATDEESPPVVSPIAARHALAQLLQDATGGRAKIEFHENAALTQTGVGRGHCFRFEFDPPELNQEDDAFAICFDVCDLEGQLDNVIVGKLIKISSAIGEIMRNIENPDKHPEAIDQLCEKLYA